MKKSICYILILLSLLGCNKMEDEKNFNGESRIRGHLTYRDWKTGKIADVPYASLKMSYDNGNIYKTSFDTPDYEVKFLTNDIYTLEFEYIQFPDSPLVIVYKGIKNVEVSKNREFITKDFLLTIDSSLIRNERSLRGRITYHDTLDNVEKGAGGIEVLLETSAFVQPLKAVTDQQGYYNFEKLDTGKYTLRSSYRRQISSNQEDLVYNAAADVAILTNQFMAHKNLVLHWDRSTSVLIVKAEDSLQNPLQGVNICVYTNQLLLWKNLHTCGGSLRTGNSNQEGEVYFTGLREAEHYIYGMVMAGAAVLETDSTLSTGGNVPVKGEIHTTKITLKVK